MEGNVVRGGAAAFLAMSGTAPSASSMRFLKQYNESRWSDESLMSRLSDHSRRFAERARQAYEDAYSDEMFRTMRSLRDQFTHAFQEDTIHRLRGIGDYQNAPPIMQRFILSDPIIRQRAQQQRTAAYDEDYVDREPQVPTEWHRDRMLSTNGFAIENDEGELELSFFAIDEEEDDPLMDIYEQSMIADAQMGVRICFEEGDEDPLDKWKGKL